MGNVKGDGGRRRDDAVREVPMTKVGEAIHVNGVYEFVKHQFINERWHKCLACGEYHDNGNLPCPFQRVTS